MSKLAPARWITTSFFVAFAAMLRAEEAPEKEYPEVAAFAGSLTDVTWELQGTNDLKQLQFDGEAMRPLQKDSSLGSPYDTVFPDEGIVRLLYSNGTSGRYIFSTELKYVTPLKIRSERTFAILDAAKAKRVASFPKDVEQVVYQSTDDGPDRKPGKFRWSGETMDFSAQNNGTWLTESHRPVVANRRVFETTPAENAVIWFVFSADGAEAWMLEVENVFGGHRADMPAKESMTANESGLTPQLNDLANHMMDLIDVGESGLVATLQRQFERRLKSQPELLERLKQRVNAR